MGGTRRPDAFIQAFTLHTSQFTLQIKLPFLRFSATVRYFMAEIGKQNRLTVIKESSQGSYLDGENLGEILLPKAVTPDWATVGEVLDVFVYRDSEDRLIATTRKPIATVGQFACLKVVETHERLGVFLDWGLEKDLLLPFREQKRLLRPGRSVVVYVMLDPRSDRIVASARLNRHVDIARPDYRSGEAVDLLVVEETPLGYRAIIENAHTGLLYKSELSEPLEYGQRLQGFIKQVRPDGKVDLRRDPAGYRRVLPLAEEIFDALVESGGFIPFDDKTPPEQIRSRFGVSKKAFKQALGSLYKQRRVRFENNGTAVVENER